MTSIIVKGEGALPVRERSYRVNNVRTMCQNQNDLRNMQ